MCVFARSSHNGINVSNFLLLMTQKYQMCENILSETVPLHFQESWAYVYTVWERHSIHFNSVLLAFTTKLARCGKRSKKCLQMYFRIKSSFLGNLGNASSCLSVSIQKMKKTPTSISTVACKKVYAKVHYISTSYNLL